MNKQELLFAPVYLMYHIQRASDFDAKTRNTPRIEVLLYGISPARPLCAARHRFPHAALFSLFFQNILI